MRRTTIAVLAAVLLLLAGCGDDDEGDTVAGDGTTTTDNDDDGTTTTDDDGATTTTADGDDGGGGDADEGGDLVGATSTETVEAGGFPSGGGEVALLADVEVGAHEGFDRIVLEFESGDVPSYRIGYVEPPVREDGSGREVDVAGDAFLELRLTPASGVDLSGATVDEIYTGSMRFSPRGTEAIAELVRTGDFEANLAWVAGIEGGRQPFAVTTLQDPLRVVVDVEHPS